MSLIPKDYFVNNRILFVFVMLFTQYIFADQNISWPENNSYSQLTSTFRGSTTFQDFSKKVEKIGFTSTTILPESSEVWTPISDGGPISLKDAYFSRMLHTYYQSYRKYKALDSVSKKTLLIKSDLKAAEKDFSTATQNLKLYKQAYPNEFSKLIERVKFPANEGSGWGFTLKSLADIREDGLESDDPLLKLLTDPNGIFADQNLSIAKLSSTNVDGKSLVNGESQSKSEEKINAPIKDKEGCNLKAMDAYKREIIRVKSGSYYGVSRNNGILTSKTPCLLLDLSFKISKNPFKRTLLGGNIMDMNGTIKSISQSEFDSVLSHWGILKNPVPDTSLSNKYKPSSREMKGAQ